MDALLEIQLILKVERSSPRLMQIPRHISEKASKKTIPRSLYAIVQSSGLQNPGIWFVSISF